MSWFWIKSHKLKTTECEHQYGHENYAECKFYVYVSTDVTADAASCWKLATFILTLEKSEPKFWMHIKHCLRSAKEIPIQEAKKLHCVDATASDAENLCRWCLASPVDIFWEFVFQAKPRKYQGVFEVKSRVKTWQVRGIWSQQLEH